MVDAASSALPQDLLAHLPNGMEARVLEPWRWLVGDGCKLVAVTLFGDAFLSGPNGEPLLLDVLDGIVRPLASSWEGVGARLRETTERDEIFLEGFVIGLRQRGITLGSGQCYGFAPPPVLGGPIAIENVIVMEIPVYEHIMASVHLDVRSREPGSVVDGMTVDGKVPRAP